MIWVFIVIKILYNNQRFMDEYSSLAVKFSKARLIDNIIIGDDYID